MTGEAPRPARTSRRPCRGSPFLLYRKRLTIALEFSRMSIQLDDWVTAQEAANALGVSRPRVHQLVRTGELEARRMAGRLFVGSRSLERVQRGRRSRGRPAIRKPLTLLELRQQRDQIVAIGRRHGAGDIRVFGSVARGDARPDSDVDFLVTLDPGRTVLDLSELIIDLEEALRRPIDVVEIRRPSRRSAGIHAE